jgi:hypothetical protein
MRMNSRLLVPSQLWEGPNPTSNMVHLLKKGQKQGGYKRHQEELV